MGRLLCCTCVIAVVWLESAVALAAPSPSPALSGLLVSPPGTGFVENKTGAGLLHGAFDAAGYAQTTAGAKASQTKQALDQDGFLTGFGRTWLSLKTGHGYVEFVMAFTGAKGAKTWLQQSELADKADPTFKNALTITGISSYYGARLVGNGIYADGYEFVKGNDTFLVSYISAKNDLGTIAATQAKRQYDAAPAYTIPPAQWPETTAANSATGAVRVIGGVVVAILIVGVIVAALLVTRSRRRPALQTMPLEETPAFLAPADVTAPAPVAVPDAVSPPVPGGPFVMSEDRLAWWDGTAWRDAAHEVPPAAQRSEDGQFWWDGEAWRPIPPSPFGS